MGLLDTFGLVKAAETITVGERVPQIMTASQFLPEPVSNATYFYSTTPFITRADAMQVPAIARARQIIAQTVGTLPLNDYAETTGQELPSKPLIKLPDPAVPRSITLTWTVDDLLFYGAAYWQVLAIDPTDGRPSQARRIDPLRVSYDTNENGTLITQWQVDGVRVPATGVNSLIYFPGLDEGILARGGRSIKTMLELEKAALRMAEEPVPTIALRNTGVDLDNEQVDGLLGAWRASRQQRATAFLNNAIEVERLGFDAAQMQLVEARAYAATEAARLVSLPAWYLSAENASATYTNVSAERRTLIELSLRGLMHCIEGRLSMNDLTPAGRVVRFDLDDFLRGNALERIEVTAKLLELGLIDEAEARAREDLAPRGA